jgi:hypothetical protein
LGFLISNHFSLPEEHKEKQTVALIFLRELHFFMVRRKSTYYKKSEKLRIEKE